MRILFGADVSFHYYGQFRGALNLNYEGRHIDLQPEIDLIKKLQNLEY